MEAPLCIGRTRRRNGGGKLPGGNSSADSAQAAQRQRGGGKTDGGKHDRIAGFGVCQKMNDKRVVLMRPVRGPPQVAAPW